MVSYDKDSKQMKESSKSKLRIDEENDEIQTLIAEAFFKIITFIYIPMDKKSTNPGLRT